MQMNNQSAARKKKIDKAAFLYKAILLPFINVQPLQYLVYCWHSLAWVNNNMHTMLPSHPSLAQSALFMCYTPVHICSPFNCGVRNISFQGGLYIKMFPPLFVLHKH